MTDLAVLKRHFTTSTELCEYVLAKMGSTVFLAFSGGKDAVGAWIQLRDMGFKPIIPYYLYPIPGLEFVEAGLRYYEDVFETKILRLPHASIFRKLNNLVFQSPENAAVLEQHEIPRIEYDDLQDHVRRTSEAPTAFTATGVRAADSPIRRMSITKFGSLNPNRRSFLPIFDWRIRDLEAALLRSKIQLTVDYRLFGRSFDGIDHRFLGPIKEHYPADYQRILEWFPLAELEIFRRTLGRHP